jgi:hypothetical protein
MRRSAATSRPTKRPIPNPTRCKPRNRGGWWDQYPHPPVTPAFSASIPPKSVTRHLSSIRDIPPFRCEQDQDARYPGILPENTAIWIWQNGLPMRL